MDDNSLNTPKSTPQKHDPSGLSFSSSVFSGSFLAQLGTPQRESLSLNGSSSSGFRRITRSQTRDYSSNYNVGEKTRAESQESGIGTTGTELETTSTSPGLLSTSTEMSIDNFVNHLMETTSNSTPSPGTSGNVRNSIRNKENETPSLNQFTPPRVAPRPLAVAAAKRRPPPFQPLSAQSSTTTEGNSILKNSRKTWSFKIIESYLPTEQDDEENNWTNFMSKLSWHPMDAQASPSFKEGEHILTCCLVRQIIIEDPQTVVLCWKGILECQHEISNRQANRILNIRPSAQNLVKYKKPGLTSTISEEDAYGNSFFKISKKSSGTVNPAQKLNGSKRDNIEELARVLPDLTKQALVEISVRLSENEIEIADIIGSMTELITGKLNEMEQHFQAVRGVDTKFVNFGAYRRRNEAAKAFRQQNTEMTSIDKLKKINSKALRCFLCENESNEFKDYKSNINRHFHRDHALFPPSLVCSYCKTNGKTIVRKSRKELRQHYLSCHKHINPPAETQPDTKTTLMLNQQIVNEAWGNKGIKNTVKRKPSPLPSTSSDAAETTRHRAQKPKQMKPRMTNSTSPLTSKKGSVKITRNLTNQTSMTKESKSVSARNHAEQTTQPNGTDKQLQSDKNNKPSATAHTNRPTTTKRAQISTEHAKSVIAEPTPPAVPTASTTRQQHRPTGQIHRQLTKGSEKEQQKAPNVYKEIMSRTIIRPAGQSSSAIVHSPIRHIIPAPYPAPSAKIPKKTKTVDTQTTSHPTSSTSNKRLKPSEAFSSYTRERIDEPSTTKKPKEWCQT